MLAQNSIDTSTVSKVLDNILIKPSLFTSDKLNHSLHLFRYLRPEGSATLNAAKIQ